jgi:hypothetical protein
MVRADGELGEPSMAWLNGYYFFDPSGSPSTGDPEVVQRTSKDPVVDLSSAPETVLAGLEWIRSAVAPDGPLNRPDLWAWMGFEGPYDPDAFAVAFDTEIAAWTSVCRVASNAHGRVILRVDA